MKINGLTVDADKIGAGLYDIICNKGEEAIVAFGMIPKWAIDAFEKQLREKILGDNATRLGCTIEELLKFVDEDKLTKETINPIVHQVSVAIYAEASRRGMMRV